MRLRVLAAVVVLLSAACSGPRGSGGDDDDDGAGGPLVGAWYGTGPDFPDGALCFIFCDNGRFFSGDSTCDQTDRGDFQCYSRYTTAGDVATVDIDGDELTIEADISADSATFTIETIGDLEFERVDSSSPLCESETVSPPEECCRYTNDGFCDEPVDCPVGSDAADCA